MPQLINKNRKVNLTLKSVHGDCKDILVTMHLDAASDEIAIAKAVELWKNLDWQELKVTKASSTARVL